MADETLDKLKIELSKLKINSGAILLNANKKHATSKRRCAGFADP
nr:hypothetical protein [uncultured Desulfobacter sp.]